MKVYWKILGNAKPCLFLRFISLQITEIETIKIDLIIQNIKSKADSGLSSSTLAIQG